MNGHIKACIVLLILAALNLAAMFFAFQYFVKNANTNQVYAFVAFLLSLLCFRGMRYAIKWAYHEWRMARVPRVRGAIVINPGR